MRTLALFILMVSALRAHDHIAAAELLRSLAPYNREVGYTLSMYPTIKGGELLRIAPLKFSDLHRRVREGERVLVCFTAPWHEGSIVHEAYATEGGRVLTRGTNNRRRDPGYLTADNLVGEVAILTGPAKGERPKGMSKFDYAKMP